MKLSIKIILPFIILILLLSGIFAYILYSLQLEEKVITDNAQKIRILNSLNEQLKNQQSLADFAVFSYQIKKDQSFIDQITQAELEKSKILDQMSPLITTSRGRELAREYNDKRLEGEQLRKNLLEAIQKGNPKDIEINFNRWLIQTQQRKAALADLDAYNINSLENTLTTVDKLRQQIFQVVIVLATLLLIFTVTLYFYLRHITKPIIQLAKAAEELAAGDFTTTTTTIDIHSNDEIGNLAEAFRNMASKLKASYQELEKKVKERTVQLDVRVDELEDTKKATLNVLEDLELEKAKDEAVLESIGYGVVAIDTDAKVTIMNEETEKLLGWKKGELIGKNWFETALLKDQNGKVVSVKERPNYIALALKKKVTTATTLYFYERKDKTNLPVGITVTPIILDGKTIGSIEVFRDISEERNLQKVKDSQLKHEIDLEQNERDFVSVASHQLMTPLALIEGYISMMLKGSGKVDEEAKGYLNESLEGAERMDRLIKTLLTTSRLENGSIKTEKSKFDINELISEVVTTFKLSASNKKLKLSFDNKEDLVVDADKEHTREVISNLISNAIKYTESGSIVLSSKKDEKQAIISIVDTGIGIKNENLPHIFEKFYMSENWIKKQGESNGLGLYITRLLLNLMGGTISVESEIGKGSTFTISLPLV